jgi:large subunit ribosomal protein L30
MTSGSGLLRITYVKSSIGYSQRQKDTVRSLGLRRLGDQVIQPDNDAVRGMVRSVQHLVQAEPVPDADVTDGELDGDGKEDS